jgi:hypothetical protein
VALPPDSEQAREEEAAARRAAEQEVLLREVDEAVRSDQLGSVAKRYGWWIVAGLVLALAAFGGYLFWSDRRESQLEANSEKLVTTLDKIEAGQIDQSADDLAELADSGDTATAYSARMARAGVALRADRRQEAVAIFDEIAAADEAPQPYRDLATIRSVAARFEELPPQQVVDRLKALATPGNPWFGSAGELVGMAYLKQGKTNLAGPLFAAIAKDEDVPQTLRSRTRQLAGLLGYDAVSNVDETLAEMRNEDQAATPPAPPAAAQ